MEAQSSEAGKAKPKFLALLSAATTLAFGKRFLFVFLFQLIQPFQRSEKLLHPLIAITIKMKIHHQADYCSSMHLIDAARNSGVRFFGLT